MSALTPQFSLENFQVETATKQIEHVLNYVRDLAQTKNINCGVSFTANGDYLVYELTHGAPATHPLTQQPWIVNLSSEFRNVNVLNTLDVEFDPLGRPVMGGGSTIQIGNGFLTFSLYVNPSTGFIQRL